jgi:hypothetical protein
LAAFKFFIQEKEEWEAKWRYMGACGDEMVSREISGTDSREL